MQAIAAGTCALGIVSAPEAERHLAASGAARLARITPTPAYADVEAVGINRHAREPDAARRLVEWMLAPEFQRAHSEASMQRSVLLPGGADQASAQNAVATIGAFDQEAVLLAERARYR
jgi:ABC-type Fe3+ transport system substrate-binding protein